MFEAQCPICGAEVRLVEVHDRSTFPFCSERCRLIDLGRWLDERYGVPAGNGTSAAAQDAESADA